MVSAPLILAEDAVQLKIRACRCRLWCR